MNDELESVPSSAGEIVDSLKQSSVAKIVRFSWWPPSESGDECEIKDAEVFSFTEGPVLIYLESGEIVGVGSDESKNSLLLWFERDREGCVNSQDIENDEGLFPIAFDDPRFSGYKSNSVYGKKIEKIELISRSPITVKYEDLPNEVGLQFSVRGGETFIIVHQLCGKSSNLAITSSDSIEATIVGELKYQEL